jgi:D-3-phosphoglycerate dehydrogenase
MNQPYVIKTLNIISERGLNVLKKDYVVKEEVEQADALILRSFNLHNMTFDEKLKAIARSGAGVNNIPVDECTKRGIAVFNTPGANANAVKELVLTSLMASSRHLFDAIEWIKTLKNESDNVPVLVESGKKQFVGNEIKGKTLGVIGLGFIGASVANDALDLDMDVIGFDPFISVDTAWNLSRNIKRAASLEELLATADYITVHVPLTENTKGMFNTSTFMLMKPGVRLLNFSRSELVNEENMKVALEQNQVGTYITDFPNENVLKMKNTIVIPHLGASTVESEENCAVMAAKQLKDYLETGNIKNSVNFPNVYLPYTGKKRVAIFHENIPNMVGQITSILSSASLNIADMINRSRGNVAYTMIYLYTNEDMSSFVEKLKEIPGMIAVRVL